MVTSLCVCQNHTLKRAIFAVWKGLFDSKNRGKPLEGFQALSDLCFGRITLAGGQRERKWEPPRRREPRTT